MKFSHNTEYSSCKYTGNYQWDIVCDNNDCTVSEDMLVKYHHIVFNATRETKVIERENSIITIYYDSCDTNDSRGGESFL